MKWYEKVLIGIGGGLCLVLVRLVRNALNLQVDFGLLEAACVAAIPLCVISTIVALLWEAPTPKDLFIRALLAPSMLVSMTASGNVSQEWETGPIGAIDSQSGFYAERPAPGFGESVLSFLSPTVHAQEPVSDSGEVAPVALVSGVRIRTVTPARIEPGVWDRALRFLGVVQEPSDWIYCMGTAVDSTQADSILRAMAVAIDTTGLGIYPLQPLGGDKIYLVSGEFGRFSAAMTGKIELVESVGTATIIGHDSLGIGVQSMLAEGTLITGREMLSKKK